MHSLTYERAICVADAQPTDQARFIRRTYANLMIVMLLGGLWHGAALNFVVWGGIHGLALALERARGRRSLAARLPRPAQTAFTFAIVCFAWVFFRAAGLGDSCAHRKQ